MSHIILFGFEDGMMRIWGQIEMTHKSARYGLRRIAEMWAMSGEPVGLYAPARRSDKLTIIRQKKILAGYYKGIKQLYDAVSEMILIVNQDRQIVFFNSVVPSLLGVDDPERIYGLRPGEAFGCIHACENPGGCGTTRFCPQCGAVNAILEALSNTAGLRECRLLTTSGVEAFDLLVRTTPLEIEGQCFCIMAISDISHQKRRRVLERIFFHDIMNTAASVKMFANMLNADPDGDNTPDLRRNLLAGIEQLMDELSSQKQLLAAENNELSVEMRSVDANRIVANVLEGFSRRFPKHKIAIHPSDKEVIMHTDHGLLSRVLGNMIQNALEASKPDEVVTVTCEANNSHAEFRVHNESHMPKEIQLQIFQRSFSTKGASRGLGTYGMKLLTERYLGGSITFSTSPGGGTTFVARYPL